MGVRWAVSLVLVVGCSGGGAGRDDAGRAADGAAEAQPQVGVGTSDASAGDTTAPDTTPAPDGGAVDTSPAIDQRPGDVMAVAGPAKIECTATVVCCNDLRRWSFTYTATFAADGTATASATLKRVAYGAAKWEGDGAAMYAPGDLDYPRATVKVTQADDPLVIPALTWSLGLYRQGNTVQLQVAGARDGMKVSDGNYCTVTAR